MPIRQENARAASVPAPQIGNAAMARALRDRRAMPRAGAQLARVFLSSPVGKYRAAAVEWHAAAEQVSRFDGEVDSFRATRGGVGADTLNELLKNVEKKANKARGTSSGEIREVGNWSVVDPMIRGPGGAEGVDLVTYQPLSGTGKSNRGQHEVKSAQGFDSLMKGIKAANANQERASGMLTAWFEPSPETAKADWDKLDAAIHARGYGATLAIGPVAANWEGDVISTRVRVTSQSYPGQVREFSVARQS